MASPANQEPNHSLAMQRQQQQQELIQLLAQHFQHQFYQLASTNGNGSSNNTIGANNSSGSNGNGSIQQIRLPLTTQQAYQPHHAHYSSEPSFVGQGSFEHLQSMNLSAVAGVKNQSFHNHLFSSHPTSITGPASTNQMNANSESITGIDFSTHQQQQNSSNSNSPYGISLMNDMNLFNALGLNLTNNQLVLSLQQHQQSLIQQARQYEMRNELEMAEQASALIRSGYISNSNESNNNSNIPSTDVEDNHGDGKTILKFSINTILGRGSPRPETDQAIKSMSQVISPPSRDGQPNKSLSNHNNSSEFRSDQRGAVSSMADCDPNETCSDSSSINNSPTPTPQAPTSTSVLFGHQALSLHDHLNQHHKATSMSGNIGSGGNHDSLTRGQQNLRHHPHQNHHSLPFLASSTAFPWTVAARGKPRRGMMRRAVFSDSQRVGLEKRFQLQKYISKPDRKKLAEKLGLRDSQVKIWFQNRRMKWRNSKERELLSAGGSREQTLPTRNNPNPDLSDVGETIKRLTATSSIEPQVDN